MSKRKYNLVWEKDRPKDERDYHFLALRTAPLPEIVSLRTAFPAPYDQGEHGTCVLNAVAGCMDYWTKKMGGDFYMPSRMQMYTLARIADKTFPEDAGTTVRQGMNIARKFGGAPESLWPYDDAHFNEKPTADVLKAAAQHQGTKFGTVKMLPTEFKKFLANGCPIAFGIQVYSSFESAAVTATGMVPMPSSKEELLGGHGIVAVGYDSSRKLIECRNSWSAKWGDNGYFWLPEEYVFGDEELASDSRVLLSIEVVKAVALKVA